MQIKENRYHQVLHNLPEVLRRIECITGRTGNHLTVLIRTGDPTVPPVRYLYAPANQVVFHLYPLYTDIQNPDDKIQENSLVFIYIINCPSTCYFCRRNSVTSLFSRGTWKSSRGWLFRQLWSNCLHRSQSSQSDTNHMTYTCNILWWNKRRKTTIFCTLLKSAMGALSSIPISLPLYHK